MKGFNVCVIELSEIEKENKVGAMFEERMAKSVPNLMRDIGSHTKNQINLNFRPSKDLLSTETPVK